MMPPDSQSLKSNPPPARDKLLFTPGPLTTSAHVKRAMLSDAGSWHFEFNAIVRGIQDDLLAGAGLQADHGYECILLQGSGTFGVEAVFLSTVPPQGKVLVVSNGAYGERMIAMLQRARIEHSILRTPENEPPSPAAVEQFLDRDRAITHVAVVHSETTTGILNPAEAIAHAAANRGRRTLVDAMSSFGAIPIDIPGSGIDYLVSSANKCIEGVPGFSFVFARRAALLETEGWARSLSLDLLAQLQGFEKNGQFRYTPPTHSILAFRQALDEWIAEGRTQGRGARYARNHRVLVDGMRQLGFKLYLDPSAQSFIITSFHFPNHPAFTFDAFYRRLSDRGFIIYPGKISQADTFRIGSIGRLFEADMQSLVAAIDDVLLDLQIPVPLSS